MMVMQLVYTRLELNLVLNLNRAEVAVEAQIWDWVFLAQEVAVWRGVEVVVSLVLSFVLVGGGVENIRDNAFSHTFNRS